MLSASRVMFVSAWFRQPLLQRHIHFTKRQRHRVIWSAFNPLKVYYLSARRTKVPQHAFQRLLQFVGVQNLWKVIAQGKLFVSQVQIGDCQWNGLGSTMRRNPTAMGGSDEWGCLLRRAAERRLVSSSK